LLELLDGGDFFIEDRLFILHFFDLGDELIEGGFLLIEHADLLLKIRDLPSEIHAEQGQAGGEHDQQQSENVHFFQQPLLFPDLPERKEIDADHGNLFRPVQLQFDRSGGQTGGQSHFRCNISKIGRVHLGLIHFQLGKGVENLHRQLELIRQVLIKPLDSGAAAA
jgi:hypothetical protein